MKRKPIKIDWEELEAAFENPNEELVYYLDLITGHVVLEGEDDEAVDDDDPRIGMRAVSVGIRKDAMRAYVNYLHAPKKIEWLRTFVEEEPDLDPDVAARLIEALGAEDPTPAVNSVLREDQTSRRRWYAYRNDRIHEEIESWLEAHGVTTVEAPPWE